MAARRLTFGDARMDAGIPSARLLALLEARSGDDVARLHATPALDRAAAPSMTRSRGRRPDRPRMWTHSLQDRAERWDRPRRVILVVEARPDDLLPDLFLLVTSLTWRQMARSAVPEHDRECGKIEGHMGELKDVLVPAQSSDNRPQTHWPGRKPRSAAPAA